MGKSSQDKKKNDGCARCHKPFGLMNPRKECVVCHQTVCKKCAPRRDGTAAPPSEKEGGKPPRVCDACHASSGAARPSAPAALAHKDAQTEEERLKRVAAMEARMAKGKSPAPQATRPAPKPPASGEVSQEKAPAPTAAPSTPLQAAKEESGSHNRSEGSNPVLEAAMRRQQEEKARGAAGRPASATSAEKQRLLREIDTLLARHNETAPFGLKSSDEGKLRSYLLYIKEKYEK